jgi:hypothetical protein
VQGLGGELDRWRQSRADLESKLFLAGLRETLGLGLTSPALEAVGLAPQRPALIVKASPNAPATVQLGLSDHRRFRAWLSRVAGTDRRSIPFGRERATVLFPDSDLPIVCLIRIRDGYCQFGSTKGPDPVRALKRAVNSGGNRLPVNSAMADAVAALPSDADLYLLVRPKRWSQHLARALVGHAVRSHRFDPPGVRRRATAKLERKAREVQTALREIRAMAFAFSYHETRARLRGQVVVEESAARRLRSAIDTAPSRATMRRWANTPALISARFHLKPTAAEQLLAATGFSLPGAKLSGGLAILALGLDTECASAKTHDETGAAALPFVVPIAGAIGLEQKLDSEAFQQLQHWLPHPSEPGRFRYHPLSGSGDQTVELRLRDEVVLVGTGSGSGAAAARRWDSSQKHLQQSVRPTADARRFVEIEIDLAAITAALATANFDANVRSELHALRQFHQQLRPALGRYRRIRLRGETKDRAKRLSFELDALR